MQSTICGEHKEKSPKSKKEKKEKKKTKKSQSDRKKPIEIPPSNGRRWSSFLFGRVLVAKQNIFIHSTYLIIAHTACRNDSHLVTHQNHRIVICETFLSVSTWFYDLRCPLVCQPTGQPDRLTILRASDRIKQKFFYSSHNQIDSMPWSKLSKQTSTSDLMIIKAFQKSQCHVSCRCLASGSVNHMAVWFELAKRRKFNYRFHLDFYDNRLPYSHALSFSTNRRISHIKTHRFNIHIIMRKILSVRL